MTNCEQSREAQITIYLGLGSNVGDREANLGEAIERIKTHLAEITRQSSIYETEPVGFTDQSWFLNQVVEARLSTDRTADQATLFLCKLLDIESEMGRQRKIVNGPRLIDIDLLLFDDLVVPSSNDTTSSSNAPRVALPHPRMHLRRFVLEPLCEIAPDLVHPVLKKPCREILASLDDDSKVEIYKKKRPDAR